MENNLTYQVKLNKQVANFTVLYTKLHHFHWYVKGPTFFSLHAKFEELYDYVAETLDELAERLLAINGKPVSTLKGALELASISEANTFANANEMVQEVVNDFKLLAIEFQEVITLAEDANDQGTADLVLGHKTKIEKDIWLLSAFLG